MANAYSAYAVYYYDAQGIGHGMAGRIIDEGDTSVTASPDMHIGTLDGDPKVEGFIDTTNALRVAVTDRVAGTAEPVYIHDAIDGSQIGSGSVTWGTQNLYTLARLGNYLYAIDYDTATVIEIYADPAASSPSYQATGATYTLDSSFNPDPSTYQAVGQALLVVDDALYGLFSFPDSSFDDYGASLIVRFDITYDSSLGRNVISVAESNGYLAKNAFSFAAYGSDIYVAAIGGRQKPGTYNADSRLQRLSASFTSDESDVHDVMEPSGDFPYEFRDISFDANGIAFVLAAAYSANWNTDGQLFSTADLVNFEERTPIDTFSDEPGYFWSAQYTPDEDRLWYARGNEILVYEAANVRPIAPVATLTVTADSLISTGEQYTNINDLSYVGASGNVSLRGYRSPLQRSHSPLAQALRVKTKGRPEATEEELAQAKASLAK